jgi:Flp pilus assembly pilin Flp
VRFTGKRLWRDSRGVLTFEWILLITLVTIGVVGGLSAVRDAVISELGDVARGMISLDQSYSLSHPVEGVAHDNQLDGAVDAFFVDSNCNTARTGRPQQCDLTDPNCVVFP